MDITHNSIDHFPSKIVSPVLPHLANPTVDWKNLSTFVGMDLVYLFPEIKLIPQNILNGQNPCSLEKCLNKTVCHDLIFQATPKIIDLFLYNSFHHKGFHVLSRKIFPFKPLLKCNLCLTTMLVYGGSWKKTRLPKIQPLSFKIIPFRNKNPIKVFFWWMELGQLYYIEGEY